MVFGFFTYPKRLNDLFGNAVNVWLILGDENALEIAANAVLTAAHKQRETMIHYAATAVEPLEEIFEAVGPIPTSFWGDQTVELDIVKERLGILLDKLEKILGAGLMQARKGMKRENEYAVQNGDSTYFRSKYPDFPLWGELPPTRY